MSKRDQHVVPHADGWAVRGARASRAMEIFERRSVAVNRGREIDKNQRSELVIHGNDGQIQSKDSHGQDSFPQEG